MIEELNFWKIFQININKYIASFTNNDFELIFETNKSKTKTIIYCNYSETNRFSKTNFMSEFCEILTKSELFIDKPNNCLVIISKLNIIDCLMSLDKTYYTISKYESNVLDFRHINKFSSELIE